MKISEALFRKYLTDACTEEERQFVEKWLNSDEGTVSDFSEEDVSQMKEQTWKKLKLRHKLHTELSNQGDEQRETVRTLPLYKKISRYAAVFALILSLSGIAYYFLNKSGFSEGVYTVSFEDYKTISNGRGQRKMVELSDGTLVWLNHDTKIKVPEEFEANARIIHLDGHAHFDVIRNPEKPFVIYTQDSKTQVLGTSFDINTHRKHGQTELIVTSGKVAFSDRTDRQRKATLVFNERAVLETGKAIKVDEVDAEKLTAWKTNQLLFEKASLADIIKVIEPWYDVTVEVAEPNLLSEKYRLQMSNPSLEEFMDYLSDLGDLQYEIEGNKITIK